ncbi:carbohydrate ABC transporter permease [Microcella sp.]|uniref:carbohydrate ABC transporter permease n=1 Tax=Microcella sp. TaxID=1913979 RepID=UPI003F71F058
MGYVFITGYAVLLLAFGVFPTLYAVYLSVTKNGAWAGIDNFAKVFADYRFWPAVEAVALYLMVMLVTLIVLVVVIALFVHSVKKRWLSTSLRFLYYLPGALAGVASVLLWLFMLDPQLSPVGPLLQLWGFDESISLVTGGNLPVIFTLIAFWTGAGGWIIIMYGALNNISDDVMEAARIDGANALQTARYIQIPMLRKWIAYMGVLSIAAGTQLFVEPRLLAGVSRGAIPPEYSLNQLAYWYAFKQADFSASAALSLMLLIVTGALAAFLVFRGGLFERN